MTVIARRRLELGLTRLDLAAHAGINVAAVAALEERRLPPELTITAAKRLAHALDLTLDALTSSAPRQAPADDDATVEALLATTSAACPLEAIADTLDWTLARTQSALDRLDRRLQSTGQTLRRTGAHTYTLAARVTLIEPSQQADLTRRITPLEPADHATLYWVLTARAQECRWEVLDANARESIARLARHELAELGGEQVQLTKLARFSLQTDRPHASAPQTRSV